MVVHGGCHQVDLPPMQALHDPLVALVAAQHQLEAHAQSVGRRRQIGGGHAVKTSVRSLEDDDRREEISADAHDRMRVQPGPLIGCQRQGRRCPANAGRRRQRHQHGNGRRGGKPARACSRAAARRHPIALHPDTRHPAGTIRQPLPGQDTSCRFPGVKRFSGVKSLIIASCKRWSDRPAWLRSADDTMAPCYYKRPDPEPPWARAGPLRPIPRPLPGLPAR